MKTQNQIILNHLQSGNPITARDAVMLYGIYRLSARIFDLRRKGHNITTKNITILKNTEEGSLKRHLTFAAYKLIKPI